MKKRAFVGVGIALGITVGAVNVSAAETADYR